MFRINWRGIAPVLLGAMVQGASAELVTWAFTGTTTYLETEAGPIDFPVWIGAPLAGELTFESSTPDSRPLDPMRGVYDVVESWSLTFTIGDFQSENDPLVRDPLILVVNDFTPVPPGMSHPDEWNLLEALLRFDDGPGIVFMHLIDLSGTMYDNDELPVTPPPLQGLDLAEFGLTASSFHARARLESLTPVPDPATGSLLLLGLVCLRCRK